MALLFTILLSICWFQPSLVAQDSLQVPPSDTSAPKAKYFAALPNSLEQEKNAEDLMKEAIAHFDGGRYQKSVQLLDEAIKINEFDQLSDILFFYRGVSHTKLQQLDAALEDYTKAINIKPQKSKYLYQRGLTAFQLERYSIAQHDFEQVLQLDGPNADIYVKLGFLKHQQGLQQEALKDYNKTIELNPKLAGAYYYRGLLYLQVLLREKACADLQKAADLGDARAEKALRTYCN